MWNKNFYNQKVKIKFLENIDTITSQDLKGFFVGWGNPPSPETHLEILKNSDFKILAIDAETNKVVGFINAISDKVLSAYIPLLEVLPKYQKQGIGKELTKEYWKN